MSGLRLDCGSNIRGPTETVNTRQATTTSFWSWRSNNLVPSSISRPACHYQSNLLQPFESLEHGAGRLLGPCPHLPPLALQPPHPLLPPLGPHCSKSPLL